MTLEFANNLQQALDPQWKLTDPQAFASDASSAIDGQQQQQQQQMPYLTYLNFGEHILSLFCQLVTIGAISTLLLIYNFRVQMLKVKNFSRSMLFYLTVHLVCSSLGLPHLIYKVFWWQPLRSGEPSVYAPYVLYWTSLPELGYMAVAPLCVLYLILDRSLALRMTDGAHQGSERLFKLALVSAVVVYCSSWGIYLLELPLDLERVSSCELASCQMRKYRNILQLSFKMLFGTANVLFCFLFLYFLAKSGKGKNLKNRVVKYTILLEIVFNVVPGYGAVAFNLATGITSSAFVGEFAMVFCAIDAAICALLYLKVFLRHKHDNTVYPNGTQVVQPRWTSSLRT